METLPAPTADKILAALPFTGSAMTWDDEIYFSTPVSDDLEAAARNVVEAGDPITLEVIDSDGPQAS